LCGTAIWQRRGKSILVLTKRQEILKSALRKSFVIGTKYISYVSMQTTVYEKKLETLKNFTILFSETM
jgi:AAA+ ATPase superfamily predicted ATPase